MQDLRLIDFKDNKLVLSDSSGRSFSVEVTEDNISILRDATRPKRDRNRTVNPRQIQTMLRSGESSEIIAQELGVELSDVQRYEGPILAEREHILSRSHMVEVRTRVSGGEDLPQLFGNVINKRVKQLSAEDIVWSVWKTKNSWMVQVAFSTDGRDRKAVWQFDHRKNQLNAENSEAELLSKQGDVVDQLIPTLRAVDFPTEDDSQSTNELSNEKDNTIVTDATISVQTTDDSDEADSSEETHIAGEATNTPDADGISDMEETVFVDDYTRRKNIEERAISSDRSESEVHSETADLLEALRKKRSERSSAEKTSSERVSLAAALSDTESSSDVDVEEDELPISVPKNLLQEKTKGQANDSDKNKGKKRRESVPSWEEILFGNKNSDD